MFYIFKKSSLLVFFYYGSCFCVLYKKYLLNPGSQRFFSYVFFCKFYRFCFYTWTYDPCKLILCMVQGVDWCFFIFEYGYPVVAVPLWWITFVPSWKFYWLYVRGSISGFSVLFLWTICVCLSISTKWSGLSLLSTKAWYQIVDASKFILLFQSVFALLGPST